VGNAAISAPVFIPKPGEDSPSPGGPGQVLENLSNEISGEYATREKINRYLVMADKPSERIYEPMT
jgi:hypothetical protein